jgi:NAD(P)-dependent dehydrogenase (short-subunit alcohol dehydrogenase family)
VVVDITLMVVFFKGFLTPFCSFCCSFLKCQSSIFSIQNLHARVVNVADLAAMQALATEVFATNNGKCHFLMNNAGVGKGGSPLTTAMDVVHFTMGVNTYGPIHGCLAFGPSMQQMGDAALIVNTGSKQGITMPPGNTTYNMSKAALKCYTEGLEHELRTSEATRKRTTETDDGTTSTTPLVRAALLIPGFVNTSIVLKSKRDEALAKGEVFDPQSVFFHEDKPVADAWMPNQVVDFMISELDLGRFYIVCPDNDVNRSTDNLRMTWTMGDIVHNRPPLSRWHDDYKDQFAAFLKEQPKTEKQLEP